MPTRFAFAPVLSAWLCRPVRLRLHLSKTLPGTSQLVGSASRDRRSVPSRRPLGGVGCGYSHRYESVAPRSGSMPTDRYFRRQSRLAPKGRLTWVVRILAVITV